jgi:TrmH family RNA methyltransferase
MRSIVSRQNPLVARFRALGSAPDPDGSALLLDGAHLVGEAHAAGTLEVAAVASSRLTGDTEEGRLANRLDQSGVDVVQLPDTVFAAISPVRTPSGIAGIAARHAITLDELCAQRPARLLAAVDVQDPGNVGALIRTAEAGGMTGAIVCGTSASPFSWKAVRGSMGSVLRLPVAVAAVEKAMDALRARGVRTVAAVSRGGVDPDHVDWSGPLAILLGGEGAGLSPDLASACDVRVSIPMAPRVDSLNVAAAGAILVYQARTPNGLP